MAGKVVADAAVKNEKLTLRTVAAEELFPQGESVGFLGNRLGGQVCGQGVLLCGDAGGKTNPNKKAHCNGSQVNAPEVTAGVVHHSHNESS